MKKLDEKKIITLINNFVLLYCPLVYIFIIDMCFRQWVYFRWMQPKAVIVSIIMVYTLYFILISLFKSAKKSITVMGISLLILNMISYVKYAFTDEPVLLSDVFYLNAVGEITRYSTRKYN